MRITLDLYTDGLRHKYEQAVHRFEIEAPYPKSQETVSSMSQVRLLVVFSSFVPPEYCVTSLM